MSSCWQGLLAFVIRPVPNPRVTTFLNLLEAEASFQTGKMNSRPQKIILLSHLNVAPEEEIQNRMISIKGTKQVVSFCC